MYKRRTYYSPRYRRPGRQGRFGDSGRVRRASLSRIQKVAAACVVLVLGVGMMGVVQADENRWGRYLGHMPIGHKKTKERSAFKERMDREKRVETVPPPSPVAGPEVGGGVVVPVLGDLTQPDKKEIAMRLVSSAENSSLDWRAQFAYIEDIGDGRGYTAGIIGFCSGTGDMLELVERYTKQYPGNPLAAFLPALRAVNGTDSHAGLGTAFEKAWRVAAADPAFQRAQEMERDRVYFNPAVALAKQDGLGALGQFMYYDAAVMHGPDAWGGGLPDLRSRAMAIAKTPAQGGDQKAYLRAFLDVRRVEMRKEAAHRDVSRIDDAQLVFLNDSNLDLHLPLVWKMYGDPFAIVSL